MCNSGLHKYLIKPDTIFLMKDQINKRKTSLGLILLLVTSNMICLDPCFAKNLSKKDEEKLKELNKTTEPVSSVFGKIETPLMAGVSVSNIVTTSINSPEKQSGGSIKLLPETQSNISELEIKRKELQKEEEQGLNFIQPSLALTQEEQKAIDEFFSRNEQEQLLNLWKSTIERNKTIQFIIQRLSPANSTQEGNSLLSKTIGAAIFLPFYALQALSNNSGAYYGSQLGGRVLGSVVQGKMQKNQTQIQLSQTESIILFMMIDEVAERLRQRYHGYKKLMVERALATNELEESKKDIIEAHDDQSPAAQVLANIQRRSVEREIRKLDAGLRSQRNTLIELAGPVAVSELDKQLEIELAAAKNTPLDFLGVEK